ncbi:MAG TPA: ATP-binding protein [Candidatus Nanoarchaeia archaeon]|nr:ATP-binding protein [Candidatus Nanoarchaeia archaeon]
MLIVFNKFVNRENELQHLNSAYLSDRSEFIVIFGRRRIGKTELLRRFIKEKRAVYFLADERGDSANLSEFRTLVADRLGNEILGQSTLDWLDTLKEAANTEERLVIAIDEYPFLINGNKAIPSIFQKAWDLYLKDSNVMLILCGSSISMMERHVLGSKSPLYGRRTGQIKVEPLKFKHTGAFFPEFKVEEQVKIYAITDGVPYYLKEAEHRIKKINQLEMLYSIESLLLEEAEVLLKYEFREPAKYFSILSAIAFGNTKFGDIVNYTGLSSSIVSQYVSNLSVLNIVEARYPVTEKTHRSRNARYYITDNYFTFWFRFIYPNKSLIYGDFKIPQFNPDFNRYLGMVFEKIASEFLWQARPIEFTKIGRWWHKKEEIDLIALNDATKEVLFIECKWRTFSTAESLRNLEKLKKKADFVKWNKGERVEYYGLVAKKVEGKESLREKGFVVFDLDDF